MTLPVEGRETLLLGTTPAHMNGLKEEVEQLAGSNVELGNAASLAYEMRPQLCIVCFWFTTINFKGFLKALQ